MSEVFRAIVCYSCMLQNLASMYWFSTLHALLWFGWFHLLGKITATPFKCCAAKQALLRLTSTDVVVIQNKATVFRDIKLHVLILVICTACSAS